MTSRDLRLRLRALHKHSRGWNRAGIPRPILPGQGFFECPLPFLLHARDLVEASTPTAEWAQQMGLSEEMAQEFEALLPCSDEQRAWTKRFNTETPETRASLERAFRALRRQIAGLESGARLQELAAWIRNAESSTAGRQAWPAPVLEELEPVLRGWKTGFSTMRRAAAKVDKPVDSTKPSNQHVSDVSQWWPDLVLLAAAQARISRPREWWPAAASTPMGSYTDASPETCVPTHKVDAEPAENLGHADPPAAQPARKTRGNLGEAQQAASTAPHSSPTFSQFYHAWIEELSASRQPPYVKGVQQLFAHHLLPAFGHMPVGSIQHEDIKQFRNRLRERPGRNGLVSNTTVNGIIGHLARFLKDASKRFGFRSPVAGLHPLESPPPPPPRPFTGEERGRIITEAPVKYRDYLRVRFATAMSTSEINALRWENVDLANSQIQVREVLVNGRASRCPAPSRRNIPISENLRSRLAELHDSRRPDTDMVFHTPEGAPIDEGNFTNRTWNPLLKRLGMDPRPPKSTRDTAVVLRLRSGQPPASVAKFGGYSDVQAFLRRFKDHIPPNSSSTGAQPSCPGGADRNYAPLPEMAEID